MAIVAPVLGFTPKSHTHSLLLVGLVPGLRVGSPTSGWCCVLRPTIVPEAVPSSSRFGPAPSRWVPLLRAWCVWGLQQFASPVYSFGMWSPFGSKVSFCHLIANEGLHWWMILSDVATLFWGRVVVFIRRP